MSFRYLSSREPKYWNCCIFSTCLWLRYKCEIFESSTINLLGQNWNPLQSPIAYSRQPCKFNFTPSLKQNLFDFKVVAIIACKWWVAIVTPLHKHELLSHFFPLRFRATSVTGVCSLYKLKPRCPPLKKPIKCGLIQNLCIRASRWSPFTASLAIVHIFPFSLPFHFFDSIFHLWTNFHNNFKSL